MNPKEKKKGTKEKSGPPVGKIFEQWAKKRGRARKKGKVKRSGRGQKGKEGLPPGERARQRSKKKKRTGKEQQKKKKKGSLPCRGRGGKVLTWEGKFPEKGRGSARKKKKTQCRMDERKGQCRKPI